MVEIETFNPIFIAFGLGIVSGVIVKYFQDRFLRPVLTIRDDLVIKDIHLSLTFKYITDALYTGKQNRRKHRQDSSQRL